MVERIRKLMEYKGLTASQFADGVEVPRAVISHILSARNKPSLEVVQKILAVHQDISLSWFLLGKGEMLNGLAADRKVPPVTAEPAVNPIFPELEQNGNAGEVQNEAIASGLATGSTGAGKAVEQVIIFYSDKSFTSYTPFR